MEWSNVDCIQLIQEYQQEEVLWNPKHVFYFSKTKKQDAWEEIGKKLNKNPEEVKKKALSLLEFYRREKAKGKKTMGTGTGTLNHIILILYGNNSIDYKHYISKQVKYISMIINDIIN